MVDREDIFLFIDERFQFIDDSMTLQPKNTVLRASLQDTRTCHTGKLISHSTANGLRYKISPSRNS